MTGILSIQFLFAIVRSSKKKTCFRISEVQMDRESEKQENIFKELQKYIGFLQTLMDNKKYADSQKIITKIINLLKHIIKRR